MNNMFDQQKVTTYDNDVVENITDYVTSENCLHPNWSDLTADPMTSVSISQNLISFGFRQHAGTLIGFIINID